MNAIRASVLLCAAAGLAGPVQGAEAYNSASRVLLESSYAYQLPSFAYAPAGAGATLAADAGKPLRYHLREIEDAIARETKHRNEALITRILFRKQTLEYFAKPDIETVAIPWSPMAQVDDISTGTADKVRVNFPVVKMMF